MEASNIHGKKESKTWPCVDLRGMAPTNGLLAVATGLAGASLELLSL